MLLYMGLCLYLPMQTHLMQTLKFGLQWNFGKAQKPFRQRNVGNLDEAARMGGGNGIGK